MKKISIVCDFWKTEAFSKRFKEKKYNVTKQNSFNGMSGFVIECKESDFENTKKELSKVLQQLEIELKQLN